MGIEIPPTLDYLHKTYPKLKWINYYDLDKVSLTADVVICSDVIEHVDNPNHLIADLKSIKEAVYFIISTPDRSLVNQTQWGPPLNKTHFREWNFDEFGKYISNHFEILEHYVSNRKQATQVIIAKRKNTVI